MDKDVTRYKQTAEMLKVLAHPVRLCIVHGLIENGGCNVSYMQACLDTPQSTTSQHLQKLRAAGIVEGIRNGLEINYHVCSDQTADLIKVLFKENK